MLSLMDNTRYIHAHETHNSDDVGRYTNEGWEWVATLQYSSVEGNSAHALYVLGWPKDSPFGPVPVKPASQSQFGKSH